MASNDTANNALNFTGGDMSINLGSVSAAGGCTGAASFCNTALTYRSPGQSYASLFQNMALYDASSAAVQFGGNSNINLTGNIYAPTADVTF
ncbi:MAG: hypothetical protein JO283_11810 [Bradyrhizobium sp.]|nr:hypothetical protein [Bradyrhizobium sp.]